MYYEQGTYLCEITSQGFARLKNENQTEYFGLSVKPITRILLTGEEEDINAEFTRTVKLWVNSESNMGRSRDRLMERGWDGGKWADLEPNGDCDLAGVEITLVCKHRTVNGEVWDDFEFPAVGGGRAIPNDTEIAKRLDRLSGTSRRKKKSKPVETEEVATETADEEVPF